MKAEKLPSGKWRARAYNRYTGERPSFTADTKREAERLAMAYEAQSDRSSGTTVKQACELYIESKSAVLSPNTLKDYRCTVNHHIDGIGYRKIESITNITLQEWVNELATELSPKSVKNIYSFVVAAIVSRMPHKAFKITLPKKIKPQMKMPSEEDIRIILDKVKDTNLDVPVRLALFCCMRRGEIAALLRHPECVGKDSVTIRYNIVKDGTNWIEKSPKTYTSYRTVPCPAYLIEDIKKTPRLNPGEITDKWIKLKTGFRFHDLRHASASMMLSANIPTVDVERFGGWRHGSSVLQDIYTYNIDESLKRSADTWQKKLSAITTHETTHENEKTLDNQG